MRNCPVCSELIHDAAVMCRFCNDPVPQERQTSPEWVDFAHEFYGLPNTGRWGLWQSLSPEKRLYAQQVLGMAAPRGYDSGFMVRAAKAKVRITPAQRSGFELRRLLAGYLLCGTMGLAAAGWVLVFNLVPMPDLTPVQLTLSSPVGASSADSDMVNVYGRLSPSSQNLAPATTHSFAPSQATSQVETQE